MRMVNLKNTSPYAEATLNVAPWYLRVCADRYSENELSKVQLFVRDVVETASHIRTRDSMYRYLKSQRSYPMREMMASDPRLHQFVLAELNLEKMSKLAWDKFPDFAVSLPLKYAGLVMRGGTGGLDSDKVVRHALAAMSVFSLKTVFKSYAVMGLSFNQNSDLQLCSAFESHTSVPLASALSGLARPDVKRSNYELLASAMMIVSGDGYLEAARGIKGDAMVQESLARQALRSFGWATVFSLSVRENAHCYSPVILDTLQRYAGYMQGSIVLWQSRNQGRGR